MTHAVFTPFALLGRLTLGVFAALGGPVLFAGQGLKAAFTPRWYLSELMKQLVRVGYLSLPVVGLTALFTGAALALNIYTGGARFNAERFVPDIVALGITRELGPVIASLMLAGRVSAAMAAEIGAMRATEQIDAMRTLSVDPFRYLVAPRLLAAVITLPILVAIADILGIYGGYLVSTRTLGFDGPIYIKNTWNFLTNWDVVSGLIKAAVFGFLIALMGCYHGYKARGGAQGVGLAATLAVVTAAILIFAANYVLTTLFSGAG